LPAGFISYIVQIIPIYFIHFDAETTAIEIVSFDLIILCHIPEEGNHYGLHDENLTCPLIMLISHKVYST
jgi:hypothetical protein